MMTQPDPTQQSRSGVAGRPRRHVGGAPLLPPVIAYAVLTVAAVVLPELVAGVSPYGSDADLLAFYTQHGGAAHLLAFLVLASAVPFAVLSAIASHRIRAAGLDVPGHQIALVGGASAAVLLALDGLSTLALTQPRVADDAGVLRALSALAFAAGGPGFVVFTGLLVAGVSVPVLFGRLAPRWVGWSGIVIAVACEIASLRALTTGLTFALPVGRFASLAWLIAVAVTLRKRAARD